MFKIVVFTIFSVLAPRVNAVTKSVYIETHIVTDVVGTDLWVEVPKDQFTAVYFAKNNTFEDILIPFSMKGTSAYNYQAELIQSFHTCEQGEIDVESFLNGQALNENLPLGGFSLSFEGGEWVNKHSLLLKYPLISQTESEQSCHGMLGLTFSIIL
ncbi:hypothetical protein [Vibrio sp. F13]|uniref:hypothetical protein n=1 Tax=Vibrio sp. F13 TaxID=2070777 RepID=UPI0010BD215F|nr:hypothetical protein [Vibrio sp. F13]TKG09031.1 hypothetical protein FCV67_07935 [Vibrio sp. F13]